jgi:hypothetical protein
MKSVVGFCLAMMLGFVLGAGFHTVKAQGPLQVYVTRAIQRSYGVSGVGAPNSIVGTQIIGFSCVHADVDADCYVLSTK